MRRAFVLAALLSHAVACASRTAPSAAPVEAAPVEAAPVEAAPATHTVATSDGESHVLVDVPLSQVLATPPAELSGCTAAVTSPDAASQIVLLECDQGTVGIVTNTPGDASRPSIDALLPSAATLASRSAKVKLGPTSTAGATLLEDGQPIGLIPDTPTMGAALGCMGKNPGFATDAWCQVALDSVWMVVPPDARARLEAEGQTP